MSATIYYRQIKPVRWKSLSCHAPSSFIAAMTTVFGDMPVRLNIDCIDMLRGMAAMCNDGGGNPYQELIDAINKYHLIEMWPEY